MIDISSKTHFGHLVSIFHNITQIFTWLFVFKGLLQYPGRYDHYWKWRTFRVWLELSQHMGALDIFLAIFGFTKNKPMFVFIQIINRFFILDMIFPNVKKFHYCIYWVALFWTITELIRFTFCILQKFEVNFEKNSFAKCICYLQFNLFIVLYPLTAIFELICCY